MTVMFLHIKVRIELSKSSYSQAWCALYRTDPLRTVLPHEVDAETSSSNLTSAFTRSLAPSVDGSVLEKRVAEAVDFKEEHLSVLHEYERRLRSQE